jgi:hypothetical protein
MKRILVTAFAWTVLSCGGEDAAPPMDIAVLGSSPTDTAPMPEVPEAVRGAMRVRMSGTGALSAGWPAVADWCPSIPALQIVADDSTSGSIVLLLPDGGDWPGTYPVTHPDSSPGTPVAHVGVLLAPARRGFTFQGVRGSLEAERDGRHLSGELQIDLREVGKPLMMKYAAAFARIEVTERTEAECRDLGLGPDAIPEPGDAPD